MEGPAIDFRKLLKEEKRRARQQWNQPQITRSVQEEIDRKEHKQKEPKPQPLPVQQQAHVEQEQHQVVVREWRRSIQIQALDRPAHLLCDFPPTVFYFPLFFSHSRHQASLVKWLQSLPEITEEHLHHNPNKNNAPPLAGIGWTTLRYAKRRVCLVDLRTKENAAGNAKAPPPPMLGFFLQALVQMGIFTPEAPPNHILINEYLPGQGILPHTDGPAYLPTTATLSLSSPTLIDFTPRPKYYGEREYGHTEGFSSSDKHRGNSATTALDKKRDGIQIYLEPGSLLVFQEDAYAEYLHGIPDSLEHLNVSDNCVNPPDGKTTTTIPRGYRISLTFRHKYAEH